MRRRINGISNRSSLLSSYYLFLLSHGWFLRHQSGEKKNGKRKKEKKMIQNLTAIGCVLGILYYFYLLIRLLDIKVMALQRRRKND